MCLLNGVLSSVLQGMCVLVLFVMRMRPARYLRTTHAVCVCNNDLIGDGITDCSPVPNDGCQETDRFVTLLARLDSDCTKLENSRCVDGVVQM
jgi:hypothetical protein